MKSKKNSLPNRASKDKVETPKEVAPREDAASERFVNDRIVQGDAVELTADGKLPPGATYAIIGKKPDGTPIIKAVRKTLY